MMSIHNFISLSAVSFYEAGCQALPHKKAFALRFSLVLREMSQHSPLVGLWHLISGGARNERRRDQAPKSVTFSARGPTGSREERNKWRGPCAVKGRPDPVGGRNLPGKSCSTRKQSEREGLATVLHEAFDAKGPARPDQRALRP